MNNSKTAAKLPQGRVMYANHYKWADQPATVHSSKRIASIQRGQPCLGHGPVLVLPMPTLAAAKTGLANIRKHGLAALLKKPSRWERMTEEQKVEAIAKEIGRSSFPQAWNSWHEDTRNHFRNYARAILSLIQP